MQFWDTAQLAATFADTDGNANGATATPLRNMQIKPFASSGSNWPLSSRLTLGAGFALLLVGILWLIWPASDSEQPGVPASARVHQAVSNVVHEAKVRVQGGIEA